MESSTITISQLADMIIIISFFTIGFSAFLSIIIEGIHDFITWIRKKRKARKELEKEKAAEQPAE